MSDKKNDQPDPILGNPVAPGFKLPASPDTLENTNPDLSASGESDKRRKISWVVKSMFLLMVGGTIGVALIGVGLYWHFSSSLPNIIKVADYKPPTVSRIVSGGAGKEEEVLAEFFRERRYVIPYDKIPQILVKAFISAEDDKFFEHQGVNLASIIRAAIANFRAGHVVQGGSTITQQMAKSILGNTERSFVRKIKELILAGRIEGNLTKQEILYLYLNQIYLGHGAHGVEAAARAYFNKEASKITLAEAALLAGLPQAPSIYSPLINSTRAKERQKYVLRRMLENKFISQVEMANAEGESIRIYQGGDDSRAKIAPYLVEHLRRYMVEKYGEKAVLDGGLTLSTTASAELSRAARRSLQEGLRAIDKRLGYRGAVRKLATLEEIEDQLKKQRTELLTSRLNFTMFQPDGRTDAMDALKVSGISSESNLLVPGELYQAVVTSFDDKHKSAIVMLGAIRAELGFDQMKWAKPEAKFCSQILTKGDLIWVKVLKVDGSAVNVALEQEPQVQGALFSLEAKTGAVLAMEGGYDFEESEFNRAIQAQRQPGSSFKPFIYSAAIEKGFTPASIIVDAPIVYEDADTGKWKPTNFEEKFYGDTTLRQALIKSRNIPTIKLVQAVQVPYLIDFSRRLGMNAKFEADLSISLGSGAVSLENLTRTYAVFPRLGRKVNLSYVQWVKDRDGKILEQNEPVRDAPSSQNSKVINAANAATSESPPPTASPTGGANRVFAPASNDPDLVMDPRVAFVMTHLMNEVVAYGTGHDAKALGRAAAGKTGTTNDYVDAWFMGFTPHIVTGVWVGNDASQKTIGPGETGARAALPIWLGFMKEAVKGYPDVDFTIPPGVVFATIDPTTGKLSSANSSRAIKEAFIEGTQPTEMGGPGGDQGTNTQSEFLKEDIE